MKKALIFDLDNTIYPVSAIAPYLFNELFELLDRHPEILDEATLAAAKDELQRRHYSLVANKYNFGAKLTEAGLNLLKDLEYRQPMQRDGFHVTAPKVFLFKEPKGQPVTQAGSRQCMHWRLTNAN